MALLKASSIKREATINTEISTEMKKYKNDTFLRFLSAVLDLDQGDYEVILGDIENRIKLYTFYSQENTKPCISLINVLNVLQEIRKSETK